MTEERRRPLSYEQIDMIASHTERAARKALRKYTVSAIAGFLILLGGIGLVRWEDTRRSNASSETIVESGNAVAVAACNRDFDTIGILRGVLLAGAEIQVVAAKRGDITRAQAEASAEFYTKQLTLLKQPDCRKSLRVLTDNPDARPIQVPTPKFVRKP